MTIGDDLNAHIELTLLDAQLVMKGSRRERPALSEMTLGVMDALDELAGTANSSREQFWGNESPRTPIGFRGFLPLRR